VNINDEYILSLDIFDTKGRLKAISFEKILENNSEIKEYLKNRYNDKFVDYKTALWRIRNNIDEWPKCPTCGKLLDNLEHKHCSPRCASLDPEVQKKNEETNLKLYGVRNVFCLESEHKKAKKEWVKSIVKKYGSLKNFYKIRSDLGNKTIKEKIEEDEHFWDKRNEKKKETIDSILKNDPDWYKRLKEKEIETKKKNNSLNASKEEDRIYEKLLNIFNKDDIIREYSEKRYPFHCDFYIKSKDLFIECNFHWTHGFHWFDKNNKSDLEIVQKWKDKNTKFYDIAIEVWTKRDILKRDTALKNKLNYLVFWNTKEFKNYSF